MSRHTDRRRPRIALFCGGRGSASITRALLDSADCQLTLLINGFDDGCSTGLVRRLIPGMLGPSDFRKNLARVLDTSLPSEHALEGLLNLRLGSADQLYGSNGLSGFAEHGDPARLTRPLASLLSRIEPAVSRQLRTYLRHAVGYLQSAAPQLAEVDMAIGNLVFAGIFLELGDFNAALRQFANLGRTRARIENVCEGMSRWLVALKDDGELLASESEIVADQSAVPIRELYLLPQPLEADTARAIAPLSPGEKQAWLAAREAPAPPSEEAVEALARADIIVFGPGTQHSSLLPSYRILAERIGRSPAIAKVLVANLCPDYDDPAGSIPELIERALRSMGDPENRSQSITHALIDIRGPEAGGLEFGRLAGVSRWSGIELIWKDWRDSSHADHHDGARVARQLTSLLKLQEAPCRLVH
jgi:2-phospho-L-lactate transferase/gluconeogenesis factor (CofD/UPF0052 family)